MTNSPNLGFYHQWQNVEQYAEMSEGVDGKQLIDKLMPFLPPNKHVLEIGMGPGKDLTLLNQYYKVTGSDYSHAFIERYLQQNPTAKLLCLDAITLDTSSVFDGIYSNKVLQHLTTDQLKKSIIRQAEILRPRGIICHSFWKGSGMEKFEDLCFIKYESEQLIEVFSKYFDIISLETYKELIEGDSLLVIGRKR